MYNFITYIVRFVFVLKCEPSDQASLSGGIVPMKTLASGMTTNNTNTNTNRQHRRKKTQSQSIKQGE